MSCLQTKLNEKANPGQQIDEVPPTGSQQLPENAFIRQCTGGLSLTGTDSSSAVSLGGWWKGLWDDKGSGIIFDALVTANSVLVKFQGDFCKWGLTERPTGDQLHGCLLAEHQTLTWNTLHEYKWTNFLVLLHLSICIHMTNLLTLCLVCVYRWCQSVCSNVAHLSRPDTPVWDRRYNLRPSVCTDGLNKQNGSAPNGKHSDGINLPALHPSDLEPGH